MDISFHIGKSPDNYDQFVCLKTSTWFASTQKKKFVLEHPNHQANNCNCSTSAILLIRHRPALSICNKNRINSSNTFVVVNGINYYKIISPSCKSIHSVPQNNVDPHESTIHNLSDETSFCPVANNLKKVSHESDKAAIQKIMMNLRVYRQCLGLQLISKRSLH